MTTAITKAGASAIVDDDFEFAEEFNFGDGGLGEVGSDEIKMPFVGLNSTATDKNGDSIRSTWYYHSGKQEAIKSIDAVFVARRKSREYAKYDSTANKTVSYCRSGVLGKDKKLHLGVVTDEGQKLGLGKAGESRKCDGCPQAQWRKVERDGKQVNARLCNESQNFIAIDSDGMPFRIRFKGLSAKPIEQHLDRYHLNRMRNARGVSDLPLFMRSVRLTGETQSGMKAWSKIEVTGKSPYYVEGRLEEAAELADAYGQMLGEWIERGVVSSGDTEVAAEHADEFGADDAPKGKDPYADVT